MLGHGTVLGTPHFTPPFHVPMWFYLGGVESLPNFEVTVTFCIRKVTTRPLQNFLNKLHEGVAAILPINDIILTYLLVSYKPNQIDTLHNTTVVTAWFECQMHNPSIGYFLVVSMSIN